VYGLALGTLYGALYALAFFLLPFILPTGGSTAASTSVMLYVAATGLFVLVGAGIGGTIGVVSGLGGGLIDLLLLACLTLLGLATHWSSRVYRQASMAVMLLLWGGGLPVVGGLVYLSVQGTSRSYTVSDSSVVLFFPGFPLFLAALAFIHIGFLVTGWVTKPPDIRAKALL
jgi:hypothetical protein